jgi:hypothetical protein
LFPFGMAEVARAAAEREHQIIVGECVVPNITRRAPRSRSLT